MKDICGRWAMHHQPTGRTIPFWCGRPNCGKQKCKDIFRSERAKLLDDLSWEHCLDRLVTLTVHHEDLKEAWEEIPHSWLKLRKRLLRVNHAYKYASILEKHKNGFPHLHVMTNVWMETHDWSEIWQACGGGIIVDARYLQKGVGTYLAKQGALGTYLAKGELRGQRTFWRTKGMKTSAEKNLTKEKGWIMIREDVYENGKELMEVNDGEQMEGAFNALLERGIRASKADLQGEGQDGCEDEESYKESSN